MVKHLLVKHLFALTCFAVSLQAIAGTASTTVSASVDVEAGCLIYAPDLVSFGTVAATSTFFDIQASPLLVSVTCSPGTAYEVLTDKDQYRIGSTLGKFVVKQPDGVTQLTTTATISGKGSGHQQDFSMSIELQHLTQGRTNLVKLMEAGLEQGGHSEIIVVKVAW